MDLRTVAARVLFSVLVAAAAAHGIPPVLHAADPHSPSAPWPVPPIIADGPVTLPSGKVLPVAPAALRQQPSAHVEMAADHAADVIPFTPGARPTVPLSDSALAPVSAHVATGAPSVILASAAGPAQAPVGASAVALPNGLRKEILGFLPHWMLTADHLAGMRYDLVTTIAYFGVAANADGTLATWGNGWNGWNSSALTGVINAAHARGVRVVLTITMMEWDGGAQQAALLGDAAARARLVDAIVTQVRNRSVDGVNLDFEPVPTTLRDQYTSFVRQLKAGLVASGVGSYLTVCTMAGAATWATGYDVAGLVAAGAADELFVMGYDFSWSGSARAGGVAPMDSPYILDVNQAVADYLEVVPGSEIIWGVPYYGRTWRTQSNELNALTVPGASGASRAYYYVGNLALINQYGRHWDPVGQVPWFTYYDGAAGLWVEGYYDDVASLAVKWDMVINRGLAGTGMWALLMDQGSSDLWNLLATKFGTDTVPPLGGIVSLPPVTHDLAVIVSWRATDPGSGVAAYSVQVRDLAGGAWTDWLTDTTATSGLWIGQGGHTYQFRLSAIDRNGNRQPWTGDAVQPNGTLTVGGFATAVVDSLNVREGAGTGFAVVDQLVSGERVNVLGGPVFAGGYAWYQIQFDWAEWPSANYPRIGWSAAGSGAVPYLEPAVAPTVTTLSPPVTGYAVTPRRFSPDGDGFMDGVAASFTLSSPASAVGLDVMNPAGIVVRTVTLGALGAGAQTAAWDGRQADGSWAPEGAYLLRIAVTDATGQHLVPTSHVDAAVLAMWGTVADLTAPAVVASSPTGTWTPVYTTTQVTFSEPVSGAEAGLRLVDTSTSLAVEGVVRYDSATRRATFDPTAPLVPARTYRASVEASVRDEVGNRLAPISWSFSTAALAGRTPGDFDGNGTTDLAVWRPVTGTWFVYNGAATQWGLPGDVPVPGDYDANGTTDLAVWRPSTGTWFVYNGAATQWGLPGDKPVPGDYDANGTTDLAVWRPANGTWYLYDGATTQWGLRGDIPV